MPGYTLDDGRTLRNLLGTADPEELAKTERVRTASRLIEIAAGEGPKGNFNADHLRALHRHIFQDVYEWAGHTREHPFHFRDGEVGAMPVMIRVASYMDGAGPAFAKGDEIGNRLDALAEHIASHGHFRGLDRDTFATFAADTLGELNSIHPFREGNGRTQRAFITELAKEAGHPLNFDGITAKRMSSASIESHLGFPNAMRRLVAEAADPERSQRLANALRLVKEEYAKAGIPRLAGEIYLATFTPDRPERVRLTNIDGDIFRADGDGRRVLVGESRELNHRASMGSTFMFTAGTTAEQPRGPRLLDAARSTITGLLQSGEPPGVPKETFSQSREGPDLSPDTTPRRGRSR